jgi:hypothetical protein
MNIHVLTTSELEELPTYEELCAGIKRGRKKRPDILQNPNRRQIGDYPGYVYLIEAVGSGRFKIGYAIEKFTSPAS